MEVITADTFKNFLQRHHQSLVSTIDLERQFLLSHLRSKFILDDEDCQRIINAGPTRQMHVVKFLDILSCKGPDATKVFVAALEFEYPLLYEKLTGKKAGAGKRSVVDSLWANGDEALHCSKELGDLEKQLILQRSNRLAKELLDTSYAYQRAVEEKRELEDEILKLSSEFESQTRYIKSLEEQLNRKKKSQKDDDNASYFQDIREIHRENAQNHKLIIFLQSQMISMNDEVARLQKEEECLKQKNEALIYQVRDLTISYDSERRNSKVLNETVKSQTHELSRTKNLEVQVRDLRYKLSLAIEEKEMLKNEFEEFRKWTELLNSRYDLVNFERGELVEASDEVAQKYYNLCDTVCVLETKVHDLELQGDFFKQTNERLTKELQLKGQEKHIILKKLEAVVEEREAAWADRNKALKEANDIQLMRELEMKEQLGLYEKVKAELANTKDALVTSQKDCMELKRQAADAKSQVLKFQRKDSGVAMESIVTAAVEPKVKEDNDDSERLALLADSDKCDMAKILRMRRAQSLLDSIRRKVNNPNDNTRKFETLPAKIGHGTEILGKVCSPASLFGIVPSIEADSSGKICNFLGNILLHSPVSEVYKQLSIEGAHTNQKQGCAERETVFEGNGVNSERHQALSGNERILSMPEEVNTGEGFDNAKALRERFYKSSDSELVQDTKQKSNMRKGRAFSAPLSQQNRLVRSKKYHSDETSSKDLADNGLVVPRSRSYQVGEANGKLWFGGDPVSLDEE